MEFAAKRGIRVDTSFFLEAGVILHVSGADQLDQLLVTPCTHVGNALVLHGLFHTCQLGTSIY